MKKQISIRLEEEITKMANQAILAYAVRFNKKPENFTEYLRRLIKDDHDKRRKELVKPEK